MKSRSQGGRRPSGYDVPVHGSTGWRTLAAAGLVAAAAALSASAAGCRAPEPPPITIGDRAITVENRTADAWQNVEVWVNDHYRVTKPRMAPMERFAIPMSAFVAGFGQRYDPGRQILKGVEVTATTADGRPVTLVWGTGRRR